MAILALESVTFSDVSKVVFLSGCLVSFQLYQKISRSMQSLPRTINSHICLVYLIWLSQSALQSLLSSPLQVPRTQICRGDEYPHRV